MNVVFAFLTGWELVALAAIVLLLFGVSRLSSLRRAIGQAVREPKKAEEQKLKKDQTKTEFI